MVSRVTTVAGSVLAGCLLISLSFSSGGFYPGATALVAILLGALIACRLALAKQPFSQMSVALIVATCALALYAVWTLGSMSWSHAPARALVESDRVVLYVFVLLLFGTLPGNPLTVRWMLRAVVTAITVVCVIALATRTLPDVFPIAANAAKQRLNYPLGYWNALGLLASLGAIGSFHLASDPREPRAMRVLAAAFLPPLAATLLLTFSRGPLAIGAVGLLVYIVVGRPRLAPTALLATAPSIFVALNVAYDAELLASRDPTTAEAAAQGHKVALAVAACALAAAAMRAVLIALDDRLERVRFSHVARRSAGGLVAVSAILGVLVLATLTDVPERVRAQVTDDAPSNVTQTGDQRDRLGSLGIERVDHWRIALRAFRDAPLIGNGAGTYQLLWERNRGTTDPSVDGHSLYLESLGELGIVGAALVLITLVSLLAGIAVRIRGPNRALFAAVLALYATWAAHAGLDWDWELPAVTLPVLALGAAALATGGPVTIRAFQPAVMTRIAAVLCVAGLLLILPARIALSQVRLDSGQRAYERGDCVTASESARRSIAVLANRPEPFAILGRCDARRGRASSSVRRMRSAVERDPDNWHYRYGLALVRARAGLDPRQAAQEALQRNPRSARAQDAVRQFRTADPARWRRVAKALPR